MSNEAKSNYRYQIYDGPTANELARALCSQDKAKSLTFQVESDFSGPPTSTEIIIDPRMEIGDASEVHFCGNLPAVEKRVTVFYRPSDKTGWLEVIQ